MLLKRSRNVAWRNRNRQSRVTRRHAKQETASTNERKRQPQDKSILSMLSHQLYLHKHRTVPGHSCPAAHYQKAAIIVSLRSGAMIKRHPVEYGPSPLMAVRSNPPNRCFHISYANKQWRDRVSGVPARRYAHRSGFTSWGIELLCPLPSEPLSSSLSCQPSTPCMHVRVCRVTSGSTRSFINFDHLVFFIPSHFPPFRSDVRSFWPDGRA